MAPPSVERRTRPLSSPVAAHIRVTPPTRLAVSSPGVSAVRVVTTCVNTGSTIWRMLTMSARPTAIGQRGPIRSLSRPPTGDATAVPSAADPDRPTLSAAPARC